MTSIIVTHENNEMDEYDFDVEIKTITIGRRSTNDVCVPHLSVSGVHCKITIDGEGTMIEDQNSTNGTYINGRLISRQLLNDGDDIVIGKARLTFLQPEHLLASADSIASAASSTVPAPGATSASGSIPAQSNLATAGSDHDFEPAVDDKEPMSLAQKAALNLRPGAAVAGAAAVTGAAVAAGSGNDKQANEHNDGAIPTASEFAGDYYEPDENEIQAMISDAPADSDTDDETFGQSDSEISSNAAASAQPALATTEEAAAAIASDDNELSHILDHTESPDTAGAVIEIKNGAKSGQVLPIDKPVTTLGRPGIQIAAIMKKPEGYFLMHIESENSDDRPRLNDSMIGDDPVMLSSGDSLKVAGIDVEFMLS